jgi:hypothetical protein
MLHPDESRTVTSTGDPRLAREIPLLKRGRDSKPEAPQERGGAREPQEILSVMMRCPFGAKSPPRQRNYKSVQT